MYYYCNTFVSGVISLSHANIETDLSEVIPANEIICSAFEVGGHVLIWGRIQSREYMKRISENETEKRIAYEVSVSKLEYVE